MEFLKEFNFSDEIIEKIKKNNTEGVIKNIVLNKNNVMLVIKYLISYGISINSIEELFIYQIGIFFRTKEEIEKVFDEYENDSIIKSFNYNVNTIDFIEFN